MAVWRGVLTTLLFTLLFSFASCDNGSTSSPSENKSGIDTSLGTPPDESLKIPDSDITVKEDCADGIYITYAIPQGKDVQSCTASIDGIGLVHENYGLEGKTEEDLFYPFVTPSKEYTVRFVFSSKEIERDGWNYGGAECVGWFDAKVTAGSGSKGEVRLANKGEIEVKANGDFRFTKKPAFEGKSRLDANGGWYMNVCLVEGISWEHTDRKTKWRGELNVPSADLGKTNNLHIYDENDSYRNDGEWDIDFLCIRPRMKYTYGDKEYTYQWDGFIEEDLKLKSEAELWTEIDIDNSDDVKKIIGTWNKQNEPHFHTFNGVEVKKLLEYHLIITSENVTQKYIFVYTKPDESEFTEEEKEKLCGGHEDEFFISPDNKTITENYHPDYGSISEYFKRGDDGYPILKVFEGEALLRIIRSGTDDGEKYEWWNDYKKVK